MKFLFELFRRKPTPLDCVSPRVQHILVAARNEADRNFHRYVGSEHLWGGFLIYSEGVGFDILKALNVNFVTLKDDYRKSLFAEKPREPEIMIPFTPKLKSVLKKGEKEARKLGFSYFGTEHLLLGFLSIDGIARDSLRRQGIGIECYRLELTKRIKKT